MAASKSNKLRDMLDMVAYYEHQETRRAGWEANSTRAVHMEDSGRPQPNTVDRRLAARAAIEQLVARWREFQNMVAASPTWLPDEMRKAQAESWARANVATGDPRLTESER